MPPRSSSPICERSLGLTLIGIGGRDIPQCSLKHFLMQMLYQTFSGGHRTSEASVETIFRKRLTAYAVPANRCHYLRKGNRSEEHTSELQSLRHLVCRLLL